MPRTTDDYFARSSFRPSVYSTGTQQLQPYWSKWPEGTGYGGDYAGYGFSWLHMIPVVGPILATKDAVSAVLGTEQGQAATQAARGAASDLLEKGMEWYDEKQEEKRREERNKKILVGVGISVGATAVVGLVALKMVLNYKKATAK